MSPSFEGARDTTIQQLTQIEKQINYYTNDGDNALGLLHNYVAASSFQDSVDQPKCHPGTREKIQSELVGWATSSNIREEKVLWIYAPAGAGKSAIARSVAEREDMNGTLLGFFAFSRHSNERNTAERLFPSLAYQLARCVPIARQIISKAIAQDPHIFAETRIEAQLRCLIAEPLERCSEIDDSQPGQAHCMIIDGLDECQNPRSQSLIIQSIVKIVSRTSFQLRFLIFSRSEPEIRSTFKRRDVSRYCVPLELDGRFTPDKDIELYLNEKFEEIKTSHDLSSSLQQGKWPNKEDILTLVRQSSGQFIYPATVMRYINDKRSNPRHRLEIILEIRPVQNDNPYVELDALYRLILESAEASYEDISHIFIVLRSSSYTNHTLDAMAKLMMHSEDDVRIHLTDLHSIIKVPNESSEILSFFHASFSDFLAKESRSGPFFIEESHSNGYIANLYLSHVFTSNAKSDIYEKQRYQHYFFKHLLKGNSEWVDNITNTFGPNSIIRIMRRSIQESWWKYAVVIGSSVPAITLGSNKTEIIPYYNTQKNYHSNLIKRQLAPLRDCPLYLITSKIYAGERSMWNSIFEPEHQGENLMSNMLNFMNYWLIRFYDDESNLLKLEVHVFPRAKWLDDGLSGDIPKKYEVLAYNSRLTKYLMKWVIDNESITLPIELYYHIFRLLFVKEALPFQELGEYIQSQRETFVEALKRFKLVQWRMNKLQMCLDDFLKKCKSKSFADYQSNE